MTGKNSLFALEPSVMQRTKIRLKQADFCVITQRSTLNIIDDAHGMDI
jgi:hypothetical protein